MAYFCGYIPASKQASKQNCGPFEKIAQVFLSLWLKNEQGIQKSSEI
jgi:hypothetical protein